MNVTSGGFVTGSVILAAVVHAALAKALEEQAPTLQARLLVSAGASIAVGSGAFTAPLWVAVRGEHGLEILGPILLACLLAVSLGVGTFVGCLLISRPPSNARSVTRWSVPLGYASAASIAFYSLAFGW